MLNNFQVLDFFFCNTHQKLKQILNRHTYLSHTFKSSSENITLIRFENGSLNLMPFLIAAFTTQPLETVLVQDQGVEITSIFSTNFCDKCLVELVH